YRPASTLALATYRTSQPMKNGFLISSSPASGGPGPLAGRRFPGPPCAPRAAISVQEPRPAGKGGSLGACDRAAKLRSFATFAARPGRSPGRCFPHDLADHKGFPDAEALEC